MKLMNSLFLILPVFVLTGCINTPFTAVAVPSATSVRVERPVDHSNDVAELEKLQRIAPPEYKLAPRDSFSIVIASTEEETRSAQVMPDGTINVAPIGKVAVAGLSVPEATVLIQRLFREYMPDCEIVLEPQTTHDYKFTIDGAITTPGTFPLIFGITRLTDAIAGAGGLVYLEDNGSKLLLSDLSTAYINRNGKILPVDFRKALLEGDALNNVPIQDGDYIYLPSLDSGKITVLGDLTGRCIPYQPNLTLLQVIALSGGTKDTSSSQIKVIRGGLKNPVVYTINVYDMQMGRIMDFPMEPRDIVFVPKDPISEWNVMIKQIMPTFQLLNTIAGPFGNPISTLYQ